MGMICKIPNQSGSQQQQQDCQGYCSQLKKTDTAPPGAAVAPEFFLQFLPRLFGRALVEFFLVFFKEIK